jgi:hypothetical protein
MNKGLAQVRVDIVCQLDAFPLPHSIRENVLDKVLCQLPIACQ